MRDQRISRRQVLTGLASAGVYGAIAPLCRAFQAHHETQTITPDQAFERLVEGNARFVSGKAGHPNQDVAKRAELAKGQSPFATIVGCSDSRVPPEVVFDQGLGDLFVVRVAGNIVDTDVTGSVEYAVEHLHTPLLVVLGHQKCGAVIAALLPQSEREKESKDIQAVLNRIQPALKDIDPHLSEEQRLAASVEANTRQSMKILAAQPKLASAVADKKLRIACGVYELSSGKVSFLA